MTSTDSNPLARQMRIIAGLLANADDPATPPAAAESYRAKADALMFQYKIESLTKPEVQGIARPGAVWTTVWVCRTSNEWMNYYAGIAAAVLGYNDCRHRVEYVRNDEDGYQWLTYEAVGLASDIAYAEALITNAVLAFGKRLEPKPEHGETFQQNCLRMRQGGMERKRIAALLLGAWSTDNEMKAKNRQVSNAIKAEAVRIGQPHLAGELLGRGTSIKTYRESFAPAFYHTLLSRIQVRRSAEQMEAHGLVLAGAKDIVDEAYYERYPSLRPSAQVESSAKTQPKCEKCSNAKSGYCREHSWMKPRKMRDTAYSTAGAAAGRHAARTVDIGTTGTDKVGGSDRRSLA